MITHATRAGSVLATVAAGLLGGCQATSDATPADRAGVDVHYLEIVCPDVDAQCAALAQVHGVSFGEAVADLGGARVADAPGGSRIGVRAPLADHEQPIIRTYLAVDDIDDAVTKAKVAGAMIAYPPTRQGDTGVWAIYILDGVQVGLWQQ